MGFLSNLARDRRGNVIALTAVALIPLIGMIGGALDLSRVYLVKSRLQQACDAGVLAYRRSMNGTNVQSTTYPAALSFFNANFSPGRYGSINTSFPQPTVDANVVVHGTATSTVPTSVMRIFGVQQITLNATCDAQLQLPNTDVMFVLDTTLSMYDTNPGDSTSKIVALRSAVQSFYTQLQNAKVPGTQLRYGFVPYSSTVNVGMLLKREWMADSWKYQSRAQEEPVVITPGSAQGAYVTTYSDWSDYTGTKATYTSTLPPESCTAPASTLASPTSNSAWSPNSSAVPRTLTQTQTYNGSSYTAVLKSGVCTVTETRYTNYSHFRTATYQQNPNAGQTGSDTKTYNWRYDQIAYPQVASLKGSLATGLMAGAKFIVPIANSFADKTIAWGTAGGTTNACIEERTAPYDMDVDTVPDPANSNTQWGPSLPGLVFARKMTSYNPMTGTFNTDPIAKTTSNYLSMSDSGANVTLQVSCPSPARKLTDTWTASTLATYLNSLVPSGQTYHDVGFMWGLRLMSAEGIFGSENKTAIDGSSISRNLIFMTDGLTHTDPADYDAYGLSALDRRRTPAGIAPTGAQQDAIVESRLTTLCTLAKSQKNITVWVIAFGIDLTPLLTNCASAGRAYQAKNADELSTTFAEIAAKIAQLRITK